MTTEHSGDLQIILGFMGFCTIEDLCKNGTKFAENNINFIGRFKI